MGDIAVEFSLPTSARSEVLFGDSSGSFKDASSPEAASVTEKEVGQSNWVKSEIEDDSKDGIQNGEETYVLSHNLDSGRSGSSASVSSPQSAENIGTETINLSQDYQASLRKTGRFRCKNCEFQAVTKAEFWQHLRGHLPPEKILECPHCPFVTEYKHHLKYHLSNHIGVKPYKCPHCSYRCINRAMLNSHMRSHSADHSYQCADCPFQAKFLHNLRLHMRRFGHGHNAENRQLLEAPEEMTYPKPPPLHAAQPPPATSTPLPMTSHMGYSPCTPPLSQCTNAQMPLDPRLLNSSQSFSNVMRFLKPMDMEDNQGESRLMPFMGSNMPVNMGLFVQQGLPASRLLPNASGLECEHCGILFRDLVLYTVHSGYHTIDNPFRCNRCGFQAEDRVSFTVHLYRASHA